MPFRKSPGRPATTRGEAPAPTRRRGIYIPVELDQRLVQKAEERGLSVQGAIREAIQEWVMKEKP